jgi:hypothetical protein
MVVVAGDGQLNAQRHQRGPVELRRAGVQCIIGEHRHGRQ